MENAKDKKRERPGTYQGKPAGKWEKLLWYMVFAAAAVMLLLLTVMAVGMPRTAKSGPDKNEMIYDYISSGRKEEGLEFLTPEQTVEIVQTVTKVLEEHAAGTVHSEEEKKLLVKEELLREYGWLTREELNILLSRVDTLLQNNIMTDGKVLMKRQQLLEEGLAGAQNSLMQKAQQDDVLGLKERDRELADRIDRLDNKLDSRDGHNDRITDEFGNLAERTDQRLEQLLKQINNLTAELSSSLEEKIRKNQEDIGKHALEAREFMTDVEDGLNMQKEKIESQAAGLEKLAEGLKACFQYVSNGKELLASTLTDKGVETEADAEFAVINNHMMELYTKAFTAGADSVSGVSAEVEYKYHYHVDSDGRETNDAASDQQYAKAGGCYTKPVYHRHQAGCFGRCERQGKYLRHEKNGKYHQWFYSCPVHGEYMHQALHADDGVGSACTHDVQYCGGEDAIVGYGCGCGMAEGQILSATIAFSQPAAVSTDMGRAAPASGIISTDGAVSQKDEVREKQKEMQEEPDKEEQKKEAEAEPDKEEQKKEAEAESDKEEQKKEAEAEPDKEEQKKEAEAETERVEQKKEAGETVQEEPWEELGEAGLEESKTEPDETFEKLEAEAQ